MSKTFLNLLALVDSSSMKVVDSELGKLEFPIWDRVIGPNIKQNGYWEKEESNWIKANLAPSGDVVNVGANCGYLTRLVSDNLPKNNSVIAIEPNPELQKYLKRNIARGKYPKRCKIYPIALGSEVGEIELFPNSANSGDSRVFDPRKTEGGGNYLQHGFSENPQTIKVRQLTLDSIWQNREVPIQLIISDTQGWDHNVLRGARTTIDRFHPKVIVEFVPSWISDLGEDPASIIDEYESWGYKVGVPELGLDPTVRASQKILSSLDKAEKWFTTITLTP